MRLQESGEMYLETILILSQKMNEVRAIDVGEEMGFSKPSVSRAVHLLENAGYLTIGEGGALLLTALGRERAEKIYTRHKILTKLLLKVGVSPEVASEDACKVEHYISDETFDAIRTFVGDQE